jgi:hypothetical protein
MNDIIKKTEHQFFKKLVIIFGIIVIVLYFLMILFSDFGMQVFFALTSNMPNAKNMQNNNITESKDRKVFVCQYKPIENPYKLKKDISIQIDETWLEKQWSYEYNKQKIINVKIHKGYQFLMKIKCKIPEYYSNLKIQIYSLRVLRNYWDKEEKKSTYFFYKRIDNMPETNYNVYLIEKDMSKDDELISHRRFLGTIKLIKLE